MKRGVFHVHSVFSDGEDSLECLVEIFRLSGMSFAAVSDHAEAFNDQEIERYIDRCESLSGDDFLVIPGLEFALHGGNIHILGYGINRRVRFVSMDQLVDGIHSQGGVAVLAHPPVGATNLIGSIKAKLDGIEVWNGRYDGTYVPRAASLQLLRSIRTQNVEAAAYCGIDLHRSKQARNPLYAEVDAETLEREVLIEAIRAGRFTLHGGRVSIPSSGELTFIQELAIAVKQPLCRPCAE
jgi:histidinol phosphatase-like PHP family hydrolase